MSDQHLPTIASIINKPFVLKNGVVMTSTFYLAALFQMDNFKLAGKVSDKISSHLISKSDAEEFTALDSTGEWHSGFYLTERAVANGLIVSNHHLCTLVINQFKAWQQAYQPISKPQDIAIPAASTSIKPTLTIYAPITLSQLAHLSTAMLTMPDSDYLDIVVHAKSDRIEFYAELAE